MKLMVQGTTSDAGKSITVTALARILANRGYRVAPFKPQNMALNSAVTNDGGEIGRAQALQALAARVEPTVDMNPVLLKPNSDTGAQVIVHGKVVANMEAHYYHQHKPMLLDKVLQSFDKLQSLNQVVLVEGAGSPAEINLRDRDIANMGFALPAKCPVVIVADIDKGGVFASLLGTYQLLSDDEQALVKGFIINRFRGDISLLESGLRWLTEQTGVPVLGVIPYVQGLQLAAEDAIDTEQVLQQARLRVVVPVLPRISNHTDFDSLRLHPQVELIYGAPEQSLPAADLIIIPGSKSVRADLAALRRWGWDKQIARHLRYGGKVMGVCGGLQMLGQRIADPLGIEGQAGESDGLGYLNLDSELKPHKRLKKVSGHLQLNGIKTEVEGYEIHAGISRVSEHQPFVIEGCAAGALSDDGQVLASYVHGLFDQPKTLQALLAWAGADTDLQPSSAEQQQAELERLARAFEANLDMDALLAIMAAD
ncbi:cobyric acid synthase [Paraferrimonas haliotis]|uniref:Cobyric acid synthase n=1 Tax=Paraferrimonas haliotis TaxID=2013866 RepID=A0AA37WX80_9GAMM|nr:cobyric acid synthase [Paraferrimonas haliotis]GLS82100.1 cobyric acid synthase [Paraferrimonas haliotis]